MHRTHRGFFGVIASLSCAAVLMMVPVRARAAGLTDTQRAQRARLSVGKRVDADVRALA